MFEIGVGDNKILICCETMKTGPLFGRGNVGFWLGDFILREEKMKADISNAVDLGGILLDY